MNPKVQSTVDADALAHMTDRWTKYNMDVCGPVALDLAVSEEACHHKHFTAPGAGRADILLVSRADSAHSKLASIALGSVLAARMDLA